MAIQERQTPQTPIPSPAEIKSGPQSFTEEELKQLIDLRNDLNQTAIQFGQVAMSKIKLEETETKLKSQLADLEKKEVTLAKNLSDKYGKGSIDLESGTFTPSK
jgi:hypothetical protein